jgi:HK97 family phage major capsid protein
MASYELDGDQPNVARSIPMLIADAKERLEEIAFTTGAGTSTPAGTITRATVDANVAVLTTANAPGVFSLLANLPVRFRVGDQARPRWVANIAVINALRAITPFAAATSSIVNDNTPDGIPEMLSIDFLESTTMDGALGTGGHKGLLLMDGNSYLVVDRIGTQMVYEPLVPGAGGINPAGISGWFAWSRVGADVSTATALRVHSTT